MAEDGKVEILTGVNIVGFCLVFLAGWIDVVGVKMFFSERSAFMTGRASNMGANFAKGGVMTNEAWFIIVVVLAFIVGAAIGTKLTKAFGLVGGLSFTGLLIIITAWMIGPLSAPVAKGAGSFVAGRALLGILIPMALGCQNASTSATPINRTTHLTGPATDIGTNIALGNLNLFIFWLLRWIGFPLGAFIGYGMYVSGNAPMALGLAGVGVLIVGVVQKATVDIPLK